MPHKQKAVAEEKTRVVMECLAGKMGQSEAANFFAVVADILPNILPQREPWYAMNAVISY